MSLKTQNEFPITVIRVKQKETPDAKIVRLEAENALLNGEVIQLKAEKATIEAQVVQVNADLMGFMEFYFANQP
ncbi:hypothetical protein [Brevibacillus centrosporus]|uniref:hypothetical protein n=1 Tax=Brevibacillus centrosporus TaxID=54910 RepID=UPI002E1D84AF|nr:hypothetical protein [Brevibacillus centrosporus]